MPRRYRPRSTPKENLHIVIQAIPWRLLLLIPVLLVAAIPAYVYGAHVGTRVLPSMTNFFYNLSAPPPTPSPTPLPALPTILPQSGSVLYTVQNGDSCVGILSSQMQMSDAGQIFSDVKPNTVKALDAALDQDCHALQPGMVLPLSPHYPLIAFGGEVLKVQSTAPQQVVPTPLINVAHQQQLGVDCTDGCLLTVRIASNVQVSLLVQTMLPVRVGSWVWAQAMLARKTVANFDTYPYVDPTASLNGMSLRACDLQVDNTHDENSLSCAQLLPNTIDDDNGAWLFGVTGSGALDHWHYPLHFPPGTRVLLWLSTDNDGNLKFHQGNPLYRYDEGAYVYVRA